VRPSFNADILVQREDCWQTLTDEPRAIQKAPSRESILVEFGGALRRIMEHMRRSKTLHDLGLSAICGHHDSVLAAFRRIIFDTESQRD
jgi:hypothetical protein